MTNENKVEGTLKDIGGKIKETVGDLTGNDKLKGEGLADQAEGKAQKGVGTVEEKLKK